MDQRIQILVARVAVAIAVIAFAGVLAVTCSRLEPEETDVPDRTVASP